MNLKRSLSPTRLGRQGKANGHLQRGIGLHRSGHLAKAIGAYSAALLAASDCREARHNLAIALTEAGRFADALQEWDHLAASAPDDAELVSCRGQTLVAAGRFEEGLACALSGLDTHPDHPGMLALAGRVLHRMGHSQTALPILQRAVEIEPGDAEPHYDLSDALLTLGQTQAGIGQALTALRIEPIYARAVGVANALNGAGHYTAALEVTGFGQGFELLNARATALKGVGLFEEGIVAGQQALAAAPDNPLMRFNLATSRLALGDMTASAWQLFEARLHLHDVPGWTATAARWTGQDIRGRTLLLHAEQGLGDTVQFVRYVPLLASYGARIVLVVQPSLFRLLRYMDGVAQVVAIGDELPAFDLYCPLLSLPGILGTTIGTIPPPIPYPPQAYARAPSRLGDVDGMRVGLVWSGNRDYIHDRHRSLDAADLVPLAGIPGVQFVSLQHQPQDELPVELGAIDPMPGVQDFADTAALIAELDLVIAVDTSVAHLAATMGKPVWLLSRFLGCWRWLHHRSDSPWYPGMAIYRQSQPGIWASTIARVAHDLTQLAAAFPSRNGSRIASRHGTGLEPPCRACGSAAPAFGSVAFAAAVPLEAVTYHRCPDCALLFTTDLDGWTDTELSTHIYNEGHPAADPDYRDNAPAAGAHLLGLLFGPSCGDLSLLDYGGDGRLAELARSEHGMVTEAYDPRLCRQAPPRARLFPVVTCFDMLEHATRPHALIQGLATLLAPDGIAVFSTTVQPPDIMRHGLAWPYIAPRLGHVTIFSAEALRCVWQRSGFAVRSYGTNLHVAFRTGSLFAGLEAESKDLPSNLKKWARVIAGRAREARPVPRRTSVHACCD